MVGDHRGGGGMDWWRCLQRSSGVSSGSVDNTTARLVDGRFDRSALRTGNGSPSVGNQVPANDVIVVEKTPSYFMPLSERR